MKVCPHCSSTEIDKDHQRGATICMGCGSVLEDQIIVSEVQFAETAGGGASVIGQHISADGGRSLSIGGVFHAGLSRQSREITLQNGKRKIQHLGSQLRLNQHCTDTAFNFFKMAVARRLTRGRRTAHVIAACLYIVCRTEGTPHMLLDFSDVLRINVYVLGRTYLHLARKLCINMPTIDPCLLIHRFAHRLEFGDKEHAVSMTALRLVSRMKRDWMATGRRPSGLCGAALLVAARIYNFSRSMKDIICVVKVCESTLKKRLSEFEETASSQLTVDEFQRIDLEEEADPPAFTMSKRKAKEMQLASDQAQPDEDEEDEEDVEAEVGQSGKNVNMDDYSTEIDTLSHEIDEAIETKASRQAKKLELDAQAMLGENMDSLGRNLDASASEEEEAQAQAFIEKQILNDCISEAGEGDAALSNASHVLSTVGSLLSWGPSTGQDCLTPAAAFGPRPTAASLGILPSVPKECTDGGSRDADTCDTDGVVQDDGELDLVGINDDEICQFLMTPEEVSKKTVLWMQLNADYLREQEEKKKREEEEERESKPEAATAKRKKRQYKKRAHIQASTAGEAIEKIVLERKISSKINYEVLKDLNLIDDGSKAKLQSQSDAAAATTALGQGFKRPGEPLATPKALKKVKFKEESAPSPALAKPEPKPAGAVEVVIESGPVVYSTGRDDVHSHEDDYDDDEGDEDGPISAARLLGHAADDDYEAYGDDYNDD